MVEFNSAVIELDFSLLGDVVGEIVSLHNSSVKVLTPSTSEWVFQYRAFKEVVKIKWSYIGGL